MPRFLDFTQELTHILWNPFRVDSRVLCVIPKIERLVLCEVRIVKEAVKGRTFLQSVG